MTVVKLVSARVWDSSTSHHGTRVRRGTRVAVTALGGFVGLGEAAPLRGRSRESLDETRCALEEWVRRIGGDIDLKSDPLAQVEELVAPLHKTGIRAASFAGETALLDLVAQVRGVPMAALWRTDPVSQVIELNAALDGAGPGRHDEDLLIRMRRGFRTYKLKAAGAPFEKQLAALEHLRNMLGPEPSLRLDVGGSWALGDVEGNLAHLVHLKLEYVEQPVAASELLHVPRGIVPMAADETIEVDGGLEDVVAAQNCAVAVIKPALLGGLLVARRLASLAQERGLDVVITHAFDGPIGLAAACELALSLPKPPRACGLARHRGLAAWPSLSLPQLDGPRLRPVQEAGLGLSTDERLRVSSEAEG